MNSARFRLGTDKVNEANNATSTWKVGGPGGYNAAHITDADGQIIARVFGIPSNWSLRDCAHADFAGVLGDEAKGALSKAHLIASAPELLAALERYMATCKPASVEADEAYCIARAAIAKAKWEPSNVIS